jgi:hypothetical protein
MFGTNVSCIALVRYKKNNLKIVLYYNSNYVITNTLITDYHTLVLVTSTTIIIIIIIISLYLWHCNPVRAMASSSHEVSWSHTTGHSW